LPVYPGAIKKILSTAILLLILLPVVTISGVKSTPVSADSGPDLVVQDIALSPSDPAIDDTVTITVTVKNQGTALAGQNYLVCYVDSAILATVPVNALQAGTMATATFTWRADGGSHTIKAIADSTDIIIEGNETNNTRTYSITTRAADLIVQSITWAPASPSRGDAVVFSVIIKNQGNASSRPTNIDLYIDGASRGNQDILAIDPGTTATRTYNWVALFGQHAIKAVVDELNNVKESNESNNEYTATYTTSPPDLIIDKITWAPLNPSKNDTVSINATVKNQGSGRADACHVAYFIDGELKSTVPVNALEAGASVNVTFNWTVTSDKLQVRTVVDYYQNVSESDETNNEKTATISTLAPDLAVTSITWSPINAAVGDTVSINATIKNLGGGRSEKTHAACIIDNVVTSSPDIPEIIGGGEAVLTFSWVATGGSHTIRVIADYDNLIEETTKDNNSLSVTVNVIPPDLVIPIISWSPANFSIDDVVTFTVNITNNGGGRAENFNVAYFMDGSQVAEDFVGRLDAGASTNRTCTWKAINGRHTFKAVADVNNMVIEDEKNNNENFVTVAPNMPDLSVDTVTWSPADIKAGSQITFDISIKNLGTLTAGPSRVAYYTDGAAAGYTDIGQLDAGAAVTVHFMWNALAGLHTIDIVADSSNKISEIDESNNKKTASLPPPDLIVPGITWSPAGASTGENVTITATIKNQGNSRSQNTQATCYVDGLPIGTKDLPEIDAGGSLTMTFNWAAAGKHKIKVTADVNNRVTESDETNNSKEIDFGTLTPDLTIPDISWLMENPLTDDKVNVTITVRNQGTGTAGASRLTYIVDNMPGVAVNIASLPAGGTSNVSFSSYLKAGSHTVNATIDSNTKIAELDESNNTKVLTFDTIVPDLNITSISVSPVTALPGDNVTITVKVENRGRDKATNAKLSLSIDGASAGSAVIKEIGMGAMASQDFNWKAAVGTHQIIALADPDNLILESNKTNNSKSRTISIEKPATTAAPTVKPANISSTSTAKKGFVDSWWWLILIMAALLGGMAFVSVLRSARKK